MFWELKGAGVGMQLAPTKAYNLLRNHQYDTALYLVRRDYGEEYMVVLDRAKRVLCEFSNELKMGERFMSLYHQCAAEEERLLNETPDLKTQAKGLYNSIGKILRSRMETVPFDKYEERIALCTNCELLWPGMEDRLRCSKCGCFMGNKARFEALSCPIGKW